MVRFRDIYVLVTTVKCFCFYVCVLRNIHNTERHGQLEAHSYILGRSRSPTMLKHSPSYMYTASRCSVIWTMVIGQYRNTHTQSLAFSWLWSSPSLDWGGGFLSLGSLSWSSPPPPSSPSLSLQPPPLSHAWSSGAPSAARLCRPHHCRHTRHNITIVLCYIVYALIQQYSWIMAQNNGTK